MQQSGELLIHTTSVAFLSSLIGFFWHQLTLTKVFWRNVSSSSAVVMWWWRGTCESQCNIHSHWLPPSIYIGILHPFTNNLCDTQYPKLRFSIPTSNRFNTWVNAYRWCPKRALTLGQGINPDSNKPWRRELGWLTRTFWTWSEATKMAQLEHIQHSVANAHQQGYKPS